MKRYCYICGYETTDNKIMDCPECLCDNTIVSSKDEEKLMKLTDDRELTKAMLQLKEKDIIEYKMKLQQLETTKLQQKQLKSQQKAQNVLKCPKCGSTAITTGARGANHFWGLIGASKTVNRCGSCGYTWEPRR